jgi:hypothetical protein
MSFETTFKKMKELAKQKEIEFSITIKPNGSTLVTFEKITWAYNDRAGLFEDFDQALSDMFAYAASKVK